MADTIIVTGGAGFIGSNFVLQWIDREPARVVNLDYLSYAGNLSNLASLQDNQHHEFVHGDINYRAVVARLLLEQQPRAIVNFAAESHVDRSILGPEEFVRANVHGTFSLLEETKRYWCTLDRRRKADFRFLHVSTDEVYGSLTEHAPAFAETTAYAPNSPYAATKAASDHLVECRKVTITDCYASKLVWFPPRSHAHASAAVGTQQHCSIAFFARGLPLPGQADSHACPACLL